MSRTLLKSIRFLALAGGSALFLSGECQIVFVGAFIALFVIGVQMDRMPALQKLFGVIQPYLASLVLGVAFVDFFFLSNSFLLSVAHFLLCLQGLRLLSLQTNRECFGSLLLSSLMIISASTLSVDWTYFALLIVFLGSVIWTLMLLTILDEAKEGLKENTLLWRQMSPAVRAASITAFAVAFVCCGIVFVIFPRFNFQGFRGQFLQPVHKTGFSSQVDLGSSSRIAEDNSIIMRIEINPSERSQWTGYLRGRALETFDGKTWKKAPSENERIFRTGFSNILLPAKDLRSTDRFRQKYYLESMEHPLLFAQSRPVALAIERPFVEVGNDGSVQRGNGDSWRVSYAVESAVSLIDPGWNAEATPERRLQLAPFRKKKAAPMTQGEHPPAGDLLFVPPALKEKLTGLALSMAAANMGLLETAGAYEQALRKNYSYSLRGGAAKTRDPLERFLFETKRGHCEYFASAMCLLLRVRGIPARMATGFLSREWNRRGEYYVVRMKHAHAWVEAYIEPFGWVGFDPSPRDSATDGGLDWSAQFKEAMDYLNLRWNRSILSYDFERQVQIVKSVTQESGNISFRFRRLGAFSSKLSSWFRFAGHSGERTVRQTLSGVTKRIGALLLIIGVPGALLFVWLGKRRNRSPVWFYPSLVRLLEKRNGEPMRNRTLREFVNDTKPKLTGQLQDILFLQDRYYALRFGSQSAPDSNQKSVIRRALQRLAA